MKYTRYLLPTALLVAAALTGSDAFAQSTIYFDLKQGARPCPTAQSQVVAPTAIEADIPQAVAFPNPFSDGVQVKATAGMEAISIHDISGKVIQRVDALGLAELNVKTDNLSNGIYFFIIAFENGSKTSLKLCKTY